MIAVKLYYDGTLRFIKRHFHYTAGLIQSKDGTHVCRSNVPCSPLLALRIDEQKLTIKDAFSLKLFNADFLSVPTRSILRKQE